MEEWKTWTLLHWDIFRCTDRTFIPDIQKAETISVVLQNNKIDATTEEVLEVIKNYSYLLEINKCTQSLEATIIERFKI